MLKIIWSIGSINMNKDRFRIGKAYISVTNPKDAEGRIAKAALVGVNDYICVSNMRTVYLAQKDEDYRRVMNEAWMCTPDGTPLTWMAHLWGRKDVQRTDGPDLMVSMLNKPESGVKHFLLGDTEETLAAMKEKYPNSQIVGSYSPPFCGLDEYDYQAMATMINESGANVVWVSLRAPKQDYFAIRLLPYLDGKLCIGVGAAFRFALGQYKHPNKAVQKMGLTGFFWRKIGIKEVGVYFKWSVFLVYCSFDILLHRLFGK